MSNKLNLNICYYFISIYDFFSNLNTKIEKYIPKTHAIEIHEDLHKSLGYPPPDLPLYKPSQPNNASKCYLVLLSPLIIILIFTLLKALFSWMFIKNTTLFFDEYVKLIPLIIPLIVIFTWFLPYLFFKRFYPDEKKHIFIYTHSILIVILLPLFLIPQYYHHFNGKSITVEGTVLKIDISRKTRSITFISKEDKLKKFKTNNLSQTIIENAKVGQQYLIYGNKSKFYFSNKNIQPLKEKNVLKTHQ
jgi:hypothetical protein